MERESRKAIAKLLSDGWFEAGVTGSQHHFKHANRLGKVTVPHPKKDLPRGTIASIARHAGWKKND